MKNLLILLFGAVLVFSSCSEYNKVLKSDDYGAKFKMANEYYDSIGTDNAKLRSIALYEQIYQRFPKQGEGEVAYFRIGKAYYVSGDYYMGGYYLGQFVQRFPYSPRAEEAFFLSAMCSVQNSPEWSLDQMETEVAINNLQQFVDRYPNSVLIDSCNNIIDNLRFKLETKAFEGIKLYSRTENYRAAVTSAETFMVDYPMSVYKEDAFFMLIKNSYFLAKNSVEEKKKERINDTIERYSTFVAGFPNSDYHKTLSVYDEEMREELKKYM